MFPRESEGSGDDGAQEAPPPPGSIAAIYRRGIYLGLGFFPISAGYVIAALALGQPLALFPAYMAAVLILLGYAVVTIRCPFCKESLLIRGGWGVEVCPYCGAT